MPSLTTVLLIVLASMAVLSVISLAMMGLDKRAAARNTWRTPEATLHLLELLGGWPGSLLASKLFRHKTQKRSYRVVRFLSIMAHVVAVILLCYLVGRPS